jgi:hypothetical protein
MDTPILEHEKDIARGGMYGKGDVEYILRLGEVSLG